MHADEYTYWEYLQYPHSQDIVKHLCSKLHDLLSTVLEKQKTGIGGKQTLIKNIGMACQKVCKTR